MVKLKKLIALAAASALACCALAFAGCSSEPSPEEQVTADITQQLDKLKTPDKETIEELTAMYGYYLPYQFDERNVDTTEFLVSLFDGFDYVIDEIVVKDDLIKANVSITYNKYSDFEDICLKKEEAAYSEASSYTYDETGIIDEPATEEELESMLEDAFNSTLEETATTATEPFVFIYKKYGDDQYMQTFSVLYDITEKAFA